VQHASQSQPEKSHSAIGQKRPPVRAAAEGVFVIGEFHRDLPRVEGRKLKVKGEITLSLTHQRIVFIELAYFFV
jgi:hypothetical protein